MKDLSHESRRYRLAYLSGSGVMDGCSAWSPHGARIAFSPQREHESQIVEMNRAVTVFVNLQTRLASLLIRDGRPMERELLSGRRLGATSTDFVWCT
jgi:hypothetical protein